MAGKRITRIPVCKDVLIQVETDHVDGDYTHHIRFKRGQESSVGHPEMTSGLSVSSAREAHEKIRSAHARAAEDIVYAIKRKWIRIDDIIHL